MAIHHCEAESGHDVFHAIADPTRRSILQLLATEDLSIAAIVREFDIGRTAINKHLQMLFDAGLVHRHKVGRETRYSLVPEPLRELQQWLSFFDEYWDARLSSLKGYLENEGQPNQPKT